MRLKRLAAGGAAIVSLSLILGVAVHFPLVRRYLAGEFRTSFVDSRQYAGVVFIARAEVEDLYAQGKAVFVDSRRPDEFAAGHIPGARSIPLGASDKGLADLAALFPPDQCLVVYCEGGDCETSSALARLIHDRGFRDVRIFAGGWTEWAAAGLPAETSK
jgi:rhodanese-related sulfurtransferase